MAADADRGVYWLVNGGGSATTAAYAVKPDGRTAARVVLNLPTTDVQAVGFQGGKVYVADIGDAKKTRKLITVAYAQITTLIDGTVTYRSMDFTYPDGPRDAEAMLVAPDGRLYVVTKGTSPGIYQAPQNPVTTKANALSRVADAPAEVTDATFLPSGRVALRTATEIHEVDPATWGAVATSAAPEQASGKALAVALDGSALLAGAAGAKTPVLKVKFPSAPTPVATPAPSQASSQASSQSPGQAPTATVEEVVTERRSDQSGTRFALIAAAFVAMIAGAYTLIRR